MATLHHNIRQHAGFHLVSRCQTLHEKFGEGVCMGTLAYQISSSGMLVGMHGHVNHYDSRGVERTAVDAAKELGYDSLKDLQLAGI